MMKSIFKLYIFKLAILSLTMIFISFGANALTIEELYKQCRPYQNNGFEFRNLSESQNRKAIACMTYLAGIRDTGLANCEMMREYNKMKFIDKNKLEIMSNLSANANVLIDQVITSFTNYAENNTENWMYSPTVYASKFLYKKFPCKLDK